MADNRYRERGGHGRSDSIFSDDEPGEGRDYERQGSGESRGFFQRAGEEVRSWFGNDESGSGGQSQSQPWGDGDWDRDRSGGHRNWRGDMGQGSFSQSTGAAPFDDHYRNWRERQIEQLDREYDEYRQHRQQQFENDFSHWRQSRSLAEGSGATSGGQAGSSGASGPATASGGATAQGGNALSATEASTGSNGRQAGGRGRKSQPGR
jgi:hypothetical protein